MFCLVDKLVCLFGRFSSSWSCHFYQSVAVRERLNHSEPPKSRRRELQLFHVLDASPKAGKFVQLKAYLSCAVLFSWIDGSWRSLFLLDLWKCLDVFFFPLCVREHQAQPVSRTGLRFENTTAILAPRDLQNRQFLSFGGDLCTRTCTSLCRLLQRRKDSKFLRALEVSVPMVLECGRNAQGSLWKDSRGWLNVVLRCGFFSRTDTSILWVPPGCASAECLWNRVSN